MTATLRINMKEVVSLYKGLPPVELTAEEKEAESQQILIEATK